VVSNALLSYGDQKGGAFSPVGGEEAYGDGGGRKFESDIGFGDREFVQFW
jgi:hypothetical protein